MDEAEISTRAAQASPSQDNAATDGVDRKGRGPSAFSKRRLMLFSIMATLLGVLLLEGLARVLIAPYQPPPSLPYDKRLLWKMKPGVRRENGALVHINRLGLRGEALDPEPPTGTIRLLTLGDSSVFGFGVSDEQVFSAQVESRLNLSPDLPPGKHVQAVNGGMVGYSSLQSLHLLEDKGEQINPSLLVVANLWSDNNFDSFVDKVLLTEQSSAMTVEASRLREGLRASRLFVGMERLLSGDGVRRVSWMQQGRAASTSLAGELANIQGRTQRRVAIQDYVENLLAIDQWARAHHAETLFMVLPHRTDVQQLPESAYFWKPYREAMRAVASALNAPLVDLSMEFRSKNGAEAALFLDDLHPSSAGHSEIATILASFLTQKAWLAGKALGAEPDAARVAALTTIRDPFESQGQPLDPSDLGAGRIIRVIEGSSPGGAPAVPGMSPPMAPPTPQGSAAGAAPNAAAPNRISQPLQLSPLSQSSPSSPSSQSSQPSQPSDSPPSARPDDSGVSSNSGSAPSNARPTLSRPFMNPSPSGQPSDGRAPEGSGHP